VVAEDVARTNNHENAKSLWWCGAIDIEIGAGMQKKKLAFEVIPNWQRYSSAD
jgi:hypothetical protein